MEEGRVRKGKGCPEGDEGRRVEEGKGGEPNPAAGTAPCWPPAMSSSPQITQRFLHLHRWSSHPEGMR